jgi:UDP-glucose 4-epimerase
VGYSGRCWINSGEKKPKMILLTGGLGFLGCNLAYYLVKRGEKVILTQHRIYRIPSFLEPLVGKHIWISPCDVLDFSSIFCVMEKYSVTSIIHTAATYGQKGKLYQTLNINILGTMNVLEVARIKNVNRITFTSSQSVYQRSREKWHEEDEDLPLKSIHGISLTKKVADMICDYYSKDYELDIVITRPSQVYGPLYATGVNPLQVMVENSVAGKPTNLPEVAPDDGNNLIYVKDCARAIALIHLAKKLRFSVYNIGDQYVRYGEMADMVRKLIPGSKINLGENIKEKIREPMFLNLDRLKDGFEFKPEYDLEHGIRDYIQWLRNGEY